MGPNFQHILDWGVVDQIKLRTARIIEIWTVEAEVENLEGTLWIVWCEYFMLILMYVQMSQYQSIYYAYYYHIIIIDNHAIKTDFIVTVLLKSWLLKFYFIL